MPLEDLLRYWLRRLALLTDFGPGHLSRASRRSRHTNPRPKRPWLCRDIRQSRDRACCIEQGAHIRNRLRNSRCGAISAQAISQEHLGGHNIAICARFGGPKRQWLVEIFASQGVAPTELSRMLTLEIGFAD